MLLCERVVQQKQQQQLRTNVYWLITFCRHCPCHHTLHLPPWLNCWSVVVNKAEEKGCPHVRQRYLCWSVMSIPVFRFSDCFNQDKRNIFLTVLDLIFSLSLSFCVCMCARVRTRTHMEVYAYAFLCWHVCVCVCEYAWAHICMWAPVHMMTLHSVLKWLKFPTPTPLSFSWFVFGSFFFLILINHDTTCSQKANTCPCPLPHARMVSRTGLPCRQWLQRPVCHIHSCRGGIKRQIVHNFSPIFFCFRSYKRKVCLWLLIPSLKGQCGEGPSCVCTCLSE